MFWVDGTTPAGGMVLAALWGILHGVTPHGHSWLVLLPFMLGGANVRLMVRVAAAYGLGMVFAAAGTGALLGIVSSRIPEGWHNGVETAVGVLLVASGLIFIIKPLSAHHAVDHLCSEHCHSGEEKALLRTGTFGAMFLLGMAGISMPCPTNIPVYALPVASGSPLMGALVFITYALTTSLTILGIAVATVRARTVVEALDRRGTRQAIWRISGVIVLAAGLYMLSLGLRPHDHGDHDHAEPHAITVPAR